MTTVYVTGASAGLGRAIAEAFSRDGAAVGLIARDEEALKETLLSLPGKAACAPADVADASALQSAAETLCDELGPPDIWINNAMLTIFSRFEDVKPDEFRRVTEATYLGSVYGMQTALRLMNDKGGQIIQIGSALAYRPIPLQAPYCAAKFAIRGALDALRCELIHERRTNVRLTSVHMPAINTPQFDWARRHIGQRPQPVGAIHSPRACARAVLWASRHPDRREIWVGWPSIQVIVGNKLIPGHLDRMMASKAWEGQFEEPTETDDFKGNLEKAVHGAHRTEGRFTARQTDEIVWITTSVSRERWLMFVAAIALILLIIL
ncbi:MAG: SDR family NAD(P)-dependent oxidoreductase [Alphaproteobacteria bacterium]|nr:SDR family NAD(P)-dependent oxidoreductase [Alphaproteobacteria bacterium]